MVCEPDLITIGEAKCIMAHCNQVRFIYNTNKLLSKIRISAMVSFFMPQPLYLRRYRGDWNATLGHWISRLQRSYLVRLPQYDKIVGKLIEECVDLNPQSQGRSIKYLYGMYWRHYKTDTPCYTQYLTLPANCLNTRTIQVIMQWQKNIFD